MSNLIPFNFESKKIRVVIIGGQPMFSARDVALALGYENPAKAYQDHCKHLILLNYNESLESGFTVSFLLPLATTILLILVM